MSRVGVGSAATAPAGGGGSGGASGFMPRTKDPGVISVRLLLDGMEDADADALKAENVLSDYEVLQLAKHISISFRSIIKIESFELCRSLTRLQLDNNMLTHIEGLHTLVNLTWLDLSFNRIAKIENLDALVNLTDLSLFNNRINTIAGLDACTKLQCLSLGNNLIDQVEQIVYLKRFAALKSLALDGNPMAKAKPEAYRSFCLAFLPHLRFLDYALITPAQRTAAKDAGVTPDLLLLVEEKEMQRKRAREKQEGRTAGMRNLVEANIEVANTLLPTLFDDDQEHAKLKNLPGLPALMESLKTSFSYCCDEFRTAGLLKHNTIVAEVSAYTSAYEATASSTTASLQRLLEAWEARYQHLARTVQAEMLDISAVSERSLPELATLLDLQRDANAIVERAIKDELRVHVGLEAMLEVFESVITELRVSKLGLHEAFFRNVETHENNFFTQLCTAGEELLASIRAHKIHLDSEDDLTVIAHDRETLLGSMATSHETRVAKIFKKELELKQREEARCNGATEEARKRELLRNRSRVEEIHAWGEDATKRLADMRLDLGSILTERAHSGMSRASGRR